MANKYSSGIQSLHSHTTTSDGHLSYEEVFATAEKFGIGTIAFTDHDSLPRDETLEFLESKRSGPVKWIVGIEMGTSFPKESGDGFCNPHIIGLFVDPTNENLVEHCNRAQRARRERAEKIVDNLNKLGFEVDIDECFRFAGGDAVGRPHIVQALFAKEGNVTLLEKFADQMKEDAKNSPELNAKYEHMMNVVSHHGKKDQYAYDILLGNDPYIPEQNVAYTYAPDLDQVVKIIRDAGGIASIAHYFTVKKDMTFEHVEDLLKDKRIDGMETVYGFGRKNGREPVKQNDVLEERKEVRRLLLKHGALATGGADAHTYDDYESFAKSGKYASETRGMAETILEKTGISPRWSSF